MKLSQAIKMALSSVLANKVRSLLTMLGIIIGIASVIILIAMGEGTKKDVADSISGMGTNLITINITSYRDKTITTDEIKELKASEGIKAIAPSISGSVTVKVGNLNTTCSLEASEPSYSEIKSLGVQSGRFINQDDLDNRFRVVLVGTEVLDTLFPNVTYSETLGKTVSINATNFTIVGVLESKGTSTTGSNDNKVIIPLTVGQRLLRNKSIRTFYVEATSEDKVDTAMSTLNAFMLKKYDNNSKSFRVLSQSDLLETRTATTDKMTAMLAGVACISLVVGGIGIMNIMLVSVTERTREIGIRKAIGAKRRYILTQFLIEALFISGVGGVLGVGFGIGGALMLPKLLNQSIVISPTVIFASFGFSATVGIVFGLYPASKASKLRPIDALRYE